MDETYSATNLNLLVLVITVGDAAHYLYECVLNTRKLYLWNDYKILDCRNWLSSPREHRGPTIDVVEVC